MILSMEKIPNETSEISVMNANPKRLAEVVSDSLHGLKVNKNEFGAYIPLPYEDNADRYAVRFHDDADGEMVLVTVYGDGRRSDLTSYQNRGGLWIKASGVDRPGDVSYFSNSDEGIAFDQLLSAPFESEED